MKDKIYLRCKHCGTVVHGDLRGTLIYCKCKKIAIDQTEYYTRILGDDGDYEVIKDEQC